MFNKIYMDYKYKYIKYKKKYNNCKNQIGGNNPLLLNQEGNQYVKYNDKVLSCDKKDFDEKKYELYECFESNKNPILFECKETKNTNHSDYVVCDIPITDKIKGPLKRDFFKSIANFIQKLKKLLSKIESNVFFKNFMTMDSTEFEKYLNDNTELNLDEEITKIKSYFSRDNFKLAYYVDNDKQLQFIVPEYKYIVDLNNTYESRPILKTYSIDTTDEIIKWFRSMCEKYTAFKTKKKDDEIENLILFKKSEFIELYNIYNIHKNIKAILQNEKFRSVLAKLYIDYNKLNIDDEKNDIIYMYNKKINMHDITIKYYKTYLSSIIIYKFPTSDIKEHLFKYNGESIMLIRPTGTYILIDFNYNKQIVNDIVNILKNIEKEYIGFI